MDSFEAKKIPRRHEEYQYLEIIEDILEHGNQKSDRTGTGKKLLQKKFAFKHIGNVASISQSIYKTVMT